MNACISPNASSKRCRRPTDTVGQHLLVVAAVEVPREGEGQRTSCSRYRLLCDVIKVSHVVPRPGRPSSLTKHDVVTAE